ncbi:NADH-quinone oxidoreductase subunit C [Streptomyces sp. NBC_00467]|uniref:NADH-quinone oxidoreductase subunit C n=1 Tax=Streptomyces sp. NBC_00467 TaxID=2975752 RepID=UPI002E183BC5
MTAYDRLPDVVTDIFGEEATAELAYELLTVDVPAESWIPSLEIARTQLACTYFDWLSAVDEPGTGFRVCAHVVSLEGGRVRRLLLRTTVPHEAPVLASAVTVYAGAAWHERETHEMFGVSFTGHPHLVPLLLPEEFEGHPLRKDFVLAARVAKAWPGAKEPGESEHGGPKRRQMLPPGVPDPNEWGPLKGQLPPAPSRPARTPRAAGAAGPAAGATDRPARRTRTAGEGSASQAAAEGAPVRRSRSVSEGSASQAAAGAATPPETPREPAAETPAPEAAAAEAPAAEAPAPETPAAEAPAPETPAPEAPAPETPAPEAPAPETTAPEAAAVETPGSTTAPAEEAASGEAKPRRAGSSDAPWHHARPAFEEPDAGAEAATGSGADPEPATAPEPRTDPEPAPDRDTGPDLGTDPGSRTEAPDDSTGDDTAAEPDAQSDGNDDTRTPRPPDRPEGGPHETAGGDPA